MAGERCSQPTLIFSIRHLVRGDDDSTLLPFVCDGDGSCCHIHRARGWLDDHNGGVDRFVFQAGQCADPGFEVGNDDNTVGWNGAEQLLSGKTTSRSTRFRVFDSVNDR